jgi:hypothetical protein
MYMWNGVRARSSVGLGRVELPTFPIYRDALANCSMQARESWWAWVELNYRPHPYQLA